MTPAMAYGAEACRLYVLLALAVAAVGKGIRIQPFVETLDALSARTRLPSLGLAWTVVAVEGLCVGLLALGRPAACAGMGLALALFLLFTAAILISLRQGRALQCNCFGGPPHPVSAYDVARNLALIAAAAGYLLAPPARVETAALPILAGFAVIGFIVSAHLREIAGLLLGRREAA